MMIYSAVRKRTVDTIARHIPEVKDTTDPLIINSIHGGIEICRSKRDIMNIAKTVPINSIIFLMILLI